jgi:hypothetical protein
MGGMKQKRENEILLRRTNSSVGFSIANST